MQKSYLEKLRNFVNVDSAVTKLQLSKKITLICTIAGAVSAKNSTWFALGVQAPNYIFLIREQYQTKPDICTSLILKKKLFYFCHWLPWGNDPYILLFCL